MTRFSALVLGVLLAAGVGGCQSSGDSKMSDSKQMSAVDVCPVCRGAQAATADGKCESCMKTIGDACPHCKGTQVATADGKCPSCGKGVAK